VSLVVRVGPERTVAKIKLIFYVEKSIHASVICRGKEEEI